MGGLATAVERAWVPRTGSDRALRALLVPASAAYGVAVAVRNALYDGGWLAVTRVPARVVSVGNLTVGGTGKTPAALWLADALSRRGRRVALVARGYRKRRPGVVVVGADGVPLVSPEDGGDEAVMLARRFRGPVVTGERRADAAAAACARFAVDTLVLDDGFQHRALARDADLVLVADDPAARRLLPAGSRREPLRSLARARAALVVGDNDRGWPPLPPDVAGFRGRLQADGLVRAEGAAWSEEPIAALARAPVVAVAGVARPERFVTTIERCGGRVVRRLFFPDHHAYRDADVAAMSEAARAGLVVTTEKDLVKLAGRAGAEHVRALRVRLEVDDGDRLLDLLEGRVMEGG
jgi:tetraacyldisaccharide 4'-kinase